MPHHTPGPWKAICGADDDETRWGVVFAGGQEWLIATIENGQPGDSLETEAATARLIAAAPELLMALRDIVNGVEGIWPEARERAAAAIAKAGG